MTDFSQLRAIAYVNHGRWLSDCPRAGCGNALVLQPKQVTFHCTDSSGFGSCGIQCDIEWPAEAEEITCELAKRPVPSTRNWAPEGHWQSLATGAQDVGDLRDEFHLHDPGSATYAEYVDGYGALRIGGGIDTRQIEG